MNYNGGILSLDLASDSGWAYGPPGPRPLMFGHLRFGKSRPEIYREMRAWLNEWIVNKRPAMVVFESAAVPMAMQGHTNANTIKLLIGLCEHVEEICYGRVELREAMASQVRAHFLGTNRMKRQQAKAATMRRCRELGCNVTDDNEGDSVALWYYQVAALRPDLAVKMTPLFSRQARI